MTTPLIAVVEDNAETRALLAEVLTNAGYRTLLRDRGLEAYETIREAQPQLVILDLWLEKPGTGSQVLGMLTIDPTTQAIPVIVCTAYKDLLPGQATQLEGRGYMVLEKPFAVETLLTLVHGLIGETRAQELGADH